MAYNYNRPPNPNEFPKNHPKWYGVPAKGEVPPVNRDLIIVGGIIITIEIALAILFTDTNFQLGIVVFAIAVTVLALVLWFVLWRDKGFADTKYPFVIQIFFIILLEICIWAVYRNLTADYFGQFGTMRMYAFHIVAAPTIHLLPIYFAWKLWWGERGLPFQFSKKLIMSGVIVGFSGAIIWRLLQQFVWAGFASAAGGTVPGTFTFLNVLETPALFGIMSFVHFCVVGPVEELEFRGFTQDQAARVLPNYQAVIFSSVLFGCSHIPIAIFLYQFPTQIFVIALVGWISAGFVFGFLYMWSRSIWACIVMHGMGNWQLSVYYFSSDSVSGWGMTGGSMFVEIFITILVDIMLIFFFYFIFKFYWEPHRRGEPAFNGAFLKLQAMINDHDFDRKPIMEPVIVGISFVLILVGIGIGLGSAFGFNGAVAGVMAAFIGLFVVIMFMARFVNFSLNTVTPLLAIIVLVCGGFMGASAAFGTPYYIPMVETDVGGSTNLENYVETMDAISGDGYLDAGASNTITNSSQADKYISAVMVTLTWTDEADQRIAIRTYENQPDTFTVTVSGLGATVTETASNTHGQEGQIMLTLELSIETIQTAVDQGNESYGISIEIVMVDAGMQAPPIGVIGFTDPGNNYEYAAEITYLVPE